MIHPVSRLIALLTFFLLFSVPGWAQNTAELQGRVVDPAGHPAVSAFVIISSHDTSLLRAATTDDSGNFEFTSLPVATYSLEVKADGFPNSQIRDLRASIGQVIRIEIVLGSNDVHSSQLHATGTSMVETSNTQLGVVMSDLEVSNLPLKSRDTFELLQLQPGVQSTLGADLFFGGDQPGVVSVDGGRARSNNYNVNGGHSGDQLRCTRRVGLKFVRVPLLTRGSTLRSGKDAPVPTAPSPASPREPRRDQLVILRVFRELNLETFIAWHCMSAVQ